MTDVSGPCCQTINLSSNGKANDNLQDVKPKFGFYQATNIIKNGRSVYQHLETKSDKLFYDNETGIWIVSTEF